MLRIGLRNKVADSWVRTEEITFLYNFNKLNSVWGSWGSAFQIAKINTHMRTYKYICMNISILK